MAVIVVVCRRGSDRMLEGTEEPPILTLRIMFDVIG